MKLINIVLLGVGLIPLQEVKITIKIHRDEVWEELYFPIYQLIKKYRRKWQSTGALAALAGGVLSPFIGGLLNLVVLFTRVGNLRHSLNKISLVLFILTVPLLSVGSHCLDLLEKKNSGLSSVELQADEYRAARAVTPDSC